MGLILNELEPDANETILLRHGGGYFRNQAMFCHGGLLYLTTQRVVFLSHKVDRAGNASRRSQF